MSATALGRVAWSSGIDNEGYVEYMLRTLVRTTTPEDGPYVAMNALGLPSRGSYWSYGNDVDFSAYYQPTVTARPVYDTEPCVYWLVENKFSSKPLTKDSDGGSGGGGGGGGAINIKVSGSFNLYQKKVTTDRLGKLIKSSSLELIDGVEKEKDRPTVSIEQNSLSIGPTDFASMVKMVSNVNDAEMWGLPARHIMLKNIEWTSHLTGEPINRYSRTLHFECRWLDDPFDQDDIIDTGWKVLRGKWVNHVWVPDAGLDKTDPNNFIVFKDEFGSNFPTRTLLNEGNPLTDFENPKFIPPVELQTESNFFLLGIPTTL